MSAIERTLERCEGFANRALGVPNTPSTRISAASGNKGFTALVIMRLVEDGLLGADRTSCVPSSETTCP